MTDNELIAGFMGDRVDGPEYENRMVHRQKGGAISVNLLGYHRSWDWLMPVVEKINLLQFDERPYTAKFIFEDRRCEFHRFAYISEVSLIDAVYTVVVEFIKWHNEQK